MNILDTLLSVVAPHVCIVCGHEGAVLCKPCGLSLPMLPSICYVCARATKNNTPCSKHQTKNSPDAVYIFAEYAKDIKSTIIAFKFDHKRAAASDLGFILLQALPYIGKNTVVTYVPTSNLHIRQRGYDHAALLAKYIAKSLKLPYKSTLGRLGSVEQKGANKIARKQQLKNVFYKTGANIEGKTVLLIDDVVTTGATVEACTKVLRHSGAKSVLVAVVARTP